MMPSSRCAARRGDCHGRPGAHPGEDPFLLCQTPGHLEGLFVLDVFNPVQGMAVKEPGDVGFLHVLEPLDLVAGVGFDPDDLNRRVAFLHGLNNAHGSARGAQRDHHDVDLSIRLFVDFRTRMQMVGGRICRAVELVGHEIEVRILPHQVVDFFNGAVGALVARRQQKLPHQKP